ncbi:MAG: DUF4301 family protein [Syntrophaceae bacterium]
MSTITFSEADLRQIKMEGLSSDQVSAQIDLFQRGVSPMKLNRPGTLDDGIISIPKEDLQKMSAIYDGEMGKGRALKFVPASGAASRMFRDWYGYLERGCLDSEEGKEFAGNLNRFAFIRDLSDVISRDGKNIEELMKDRKYTEILAYILTSKGLNYGNLPKALLKFHTYPEGSRAAIEEHLVEAALYKKDSNGLCLVHFTVSEEHQEAINDYLAQVTKKYEKIYNVRYDITLSTQKSSTNTIAVDLENCPFRDQQGRLVFRPGGHGALLENLNGIDGDIIFLKNIDNIVPDRLKAVTILYKKVLAGYLISLQKEIFRYLHLISNNELNENTLNELIVFCKQKLHIVFPLMFEGLPFPERCSHILKKLNRPIRVCGMVKNEGEPGGGPFWVNEDDDTQSLQIVEENQIDARSQEQRTIWSSATHFNPVDLVCGVRNYQSQKFSLHEFVDKNSYLISQKSEKGKDLRALELPGLWNGSMAFWNTIFVEVPIETFNPVKTANDLLRPQHLPE